MSQIFSVSSDRTHATTQLSAGVYIARVKKDLGGGEYAVTEWSPVLNVTNPSGVQPDQDLDLGTGKILYSNVYQTLADLPDAASYHGMFAHVHAEGAAYYAHAGNWVRLADNADIPTFFVSGLNGLSGSVILAGGSNVQIGQSGNQLTISSTQTFSTLNGESGSLSLVGGDGIAVSTVDNIITVTATDHTSVNNVTGNVGIVAGENINVTTSGQNVVISGQSGGVSWGNPPTDPGDPGNPGDVAYDDNYLYVHTSQGWRRATLGSWNPTITLTIQPQDLSLELGQSGNFTVAATVSDGSSPSYQWQNSDDNGSTWDTITGANTTTYSLSGVSIADNGTQYRAVVSAPGAVDVTSSVASLTVTETFRLLIANGDTLLTEAGETLNHDGAATGGGNDPGPEPSGNWELIAAASGGSGDTLSPVATNQDGTVIVAGVNPGSAGEGFVLYGVHNGSLSQLYTVAEQAFESKLGDVVAINSDGTVAISRSVDFENSGDGSETGYLYIARNSEGVWATGRTEVYYTPGDLAISGDGAYAVLGGVTDSGSTAPGAESTVSRRPISGTSVGAGDSFGIAALYYTASNNNYTIRRNIGTSLATNSDGNIVAAGYQFPSWDVSGVSGGSNPGGSGLLGASPSITVYEGSWASGGGTPYVAQAGAVVVMEWTGASWAQRGDEIIGSDPLIPYGDSVSLSANGNRVAVGTWRAAGGGAERGEVQVYDWTGSTWSQVGSTLTGDSNYDHFGRSVSISADGSTLVVGSPGDDSANSNAGSVTAYTWTGSDWQQAGPSVAPPTSGTTNWLTGQSVSVSGDGFRFAASAPGADNGNGTLSVYELEDNQITITQQPQNVTYSGSPVVFSTAATVSDNSSPSYLWQSSADNGSTWANLSGETSSNLTISGVTGDSSGNQYRAVISAARAPDATTNNATLTVA